MPRLLLAALAAVLLLPTLFAGPAQASLLLEDPLDLSTPGVRPVDAEAVAHGAGRTYLAWRSGGGVTVDVIDHTRGGRGVSSSRLDTPVAAIAPRDVRMVADGEHVYVAWTQYRIHPEIENLYIARVWFSASHDGGRSFSTPKLLCDARLSAPAMLPELAADGEHVAVMWLDGGRGTAISRSDDGGDAFHASYLPTRSGGQYDVAMHGDRPLVAWIDRDRHLQVMLYDADPEKDTGERLDVGAGLEDPAVAATEHGMALAAGRQADPDGERHVSLQVASGTSLGALANLAPASPEQVSCHEPNSKHSGASACMGPVLAAAGTRFHLAWAGDPAVNHGGRAYLRSGTFGGALGAVQEVGSLGGQMYREVKLAAGEGTVALTWVHVGYDGDDVTYSARAAFSLDGGGSFTTHDLAPGHAKLHGAQVRAQHDPSVAVWPKGHGAPAGMGVLYNLAVGMTTDNDAWAGVGAVEALDEDRNVALLDADLTQAATGATTLVKGKPALVRATIRSGFSRRTAATVRVSISQDGGAPKHLDQVVALKHGPNAFVLPAGEKVVPTGAKLDVKVEVDPNGTLEQTDREDDALERSYAVSTTRGLRVLVVPVEAPGLPAVGCETVQRVSDRAQDWVRGAFPVAPQDVVFAPACAGAVEAARGSYDATSIFELFGDLSRLGWTDRIDHVVGVVPNGFFAQRFGRPEVRGLAPHDGAANGFPAVLVQASADGGWVAGHELGHDLGLEHDEDAAPGAWVERREVIAGDVRSFLRAGATEDEMRQPLGAWTTKGSWAALADRLRGGSAGLQAKAAPGDVLEIAGRVGGDGAIDAEPARKTTATPDPAATGDADVTAIVKDAGGATLATTGFDLQRTTEGTATRGRAATVAEGGAFTRRLALPAGAARVDLQVGGATRHTYAASPAAPAVTVTRPNGGGKVLPGEQVEITWDATDADGDALTASAFLSTDGGAHWQPVELDRADDGKAAFTVTKRMATKDARVRVEVTDGWHLATDESDAGFEIGSGATQERILFSRERTDPWVQDLATIKTDGTDLQPFAPAEGQWRQWNAHHTDGADRMTIQRTRWDSLYDRTMWSVKLDGSDPVHYETDRRYPATPVLSPDGKRLAYVAWNAKTEDVFYVRDLATGVEREVWNAKDASFTFILDWTPDGEDLVIGHEVDGSLPGTTDGNQLALLDADGGTPRPVGDADVTFAGDMSPDGTKIAFAGDSMGAGGRPGGYDYGIYVVDRDGTNRISIADVTEGEFIGFSQVNFSPDGSEVVYAAKRGSWDNVWELYRAKADGTGEPVFLRKGADVKLHAYENGLVWFDMPTETPAPEAPQPTVAKATGTEGADVAITASGVEPGVQLAWDLDQDGAYDDATGATVTTSFPQDGTYPVSVRATDGVGRVGVATGEAAIANAAPKLAGARLTVDADGEAVLTADATDAGSQDVLTAEVDLAGKGAKPVALASAGPGRWTLATAGRFDEGDARVAIVRVSDGKGQDAAWVDASALPANAAPTAADVADSTLRGQPVLLEPVLRDADGGLPTVTELAQPAHGTVELLARPGDEPTLLYTPDAGFTGEDTFTYRATDGRASSAAATAKVTVVAPPGAGDPDPPAPQEPPTRPAGPTEVNRPDVGTPAEQRGTPSGVGGTGFTDDPAVGGQGLGLPSTRKCLSRRRFPVTIKAPKGQRIAGAQLYVGGKLQRTVKGRRQTRVKATVDLRGNVKGRFTVRIVVQTTSGRTVADTRRYRTCTSKSTKKTKTTKKATKR